MTSQEMTAQKPVDTAAQPLPFVQPLLGQLAFAHFALHKNVDGVSHEESLRSPQPGGNCTNWVVGHIVGVRQTWLTALLGEAPLFDEATLKMYRRGSDPLTDGSLALPLGDLVAAYDRGQAPLVAGMSRLTAERLAAPAPFSPGKNPNETIGSLVATLCFHEAYHVGQLGVLRRLVGHPGGIA